MVAFVNNKFPNVSCLIECEEKMLQNGELIGLLNNGILNGKRNKSH